MSLKSPALRLPDDGWRPSPGYAQIEIAELRRTLKRLGKALDHGASLSAGEVRLIVQTNETLKHDRAVINDEVAEMVLSAIETLVDSLGASARGNQPDTPRDVLCLALADWAHLQVNPPAEE